MNYGTSDVDVNIPEALHKQENLYAIIIANEHYENDCFAISLVRKESASELFYKDSEE